jgi:hypothetical protein
MTLLFHSAPAIRPGRLFVRLAALEAVAMAVLFAVQFHMALPAEDGDWPLSIFSLVNLAAAGGLALLAGFLHAGEAGVRRLLIATGAVFLIDAGLQLALPDKTIDLQDWASLIAWTLSFVMLGLLLTRDKAPPLVQGLFMSGLIIQGIVIAGDLSLDDVLAARGGERLMDWAYVTGTAISMVAYLLGFELFAAAQARRQHSFEKLGLALHKRAYKGLGRILSIAIAKAEFGLWRLRHPQASFADFYAGAIAARLAQGGSHRTLGRLRPFSDEAQASADHAARGLPQFEALRDLGVAPHDIVVEYGCGSLRIGQHLIAYLAPGHYWGLDILADFYEAGLALLGPKAQDRQPHLRVIGGASLAEARAARPDVIVSIAVLKHVPPPELEVFLSRILGLMAPHTRLILDFDAGENARRAGAKNWTYSRAFLESRLTALRPGLKLAPPYALTRRKTLIVALGYGEA